MSRRCWRSEKNILQTKSFDCWQSQTKTRQLCCVSELIFSGFLCMFFVIFNCFAAHKNSTIFHDEMNAFIQKSAKCSGRISDEGVNHCHSQTNKKSQHETHNIKVEWKFKAFSFPHFLSIHIFEHIRVHFLCNAEWDESMVGSVCWEWKYPTADSFNSIKRKFSPLVERHRLSIVVWKGTRNPLSSEFDNFFLFHS